MEALDSQEDCKHSNKDKQMSIGRKKFNMDPKKGEFFNIIIVRIILHRNITFVYNEMCTCLIMKLKLIYCCV